MRKKLFFILALLLTAVTGAWADTYAYPTKTKPEFYASYGGKSNVVVINTAAELAYITEHFDENSEFHVEADDLSPLSGVELVRRKVKCLYIQGGSFGQSPEPDFNFLQGMDFAKTLFRLWPKDVDIVFSPMETGNGIEYLLEQVIADVSWTDRHPIKQVYMRCNCNTGQMMWDPLTVINAVEGDHLFTLTDRGTVVLSEDGTVVFTPSTTGNSRFQMPGDAAWRSAMLEIIRNCNKTNNNELYLFN